MAFDIAIFKLTSIADIDTKIRALMVTHQISYVEASHLLNTYILLMESMNAVNGLNGRVYNNKP